MNEQQSGWLVFLFSLPASRASARVDVWRRLKKYGAVALQGSGYLLPATADNGERFEWLAESVRRSDGAASVLSVTAIDNLPPHRIRKLFLDARSRDYAELIRDLKKMKTTDAPVGLRRLRQRFHDIKSVDFFGGPMQRKVEAALSARERPHASSAVASPRKLAASEFRNRTWLTRPRPGIDRVASAWLIVNHIDAKAQFRFAGDPAVYPDAIPFDMFQGGGFGHRGDDCTFETLVKDFRVKKKAVQILAEMIHDADIKDDKFGRNEAVGVEKVLKGWAAQGMTDDQLLRRGTELIDGLYRSIGRST